MGDQSQKYIPALRYDWLTSLYDPLLQLTLREVTFKKRLVTEAHLQPGQRVLDLGCGTATLTLLIKQSQVEAEVVGIDGDHHVLGIAQRKVSQLGMQLSLHHGMVFDLPYRDSTFDYVFSSLLFHHLNRENKLRTLQEAHRILRPGGQLYVADWGKPANLLMRGLFLLVQSLDGFSTTADNTRGLLPIFFERTGFTNVQQFHRYGTIFGTLCLYRGQKPAV